jgi:predicted RNase H-like nuclease
VTRVAGVDGCKAGWIVVTAEAAGRLESPAVQVMSAFAEMLAATQECAAVAVDIPIGLSDRPPRQADLLARRLLGRPRGSSVFPAPWRTLIEALEEDWYADADGFGKAIAVAREIEGSGFSRQAFFIFPKIREANLAMTPALQGRVMESHPEVSFAALNGGTPMSKRKLRLDGRIERRDLLTTVFNEAQLPALKPRAGAAYDDLYDACVLAWTAARIARGEAVHLPATPDPTPVACVWKSSIKRPAAPALSG